MDSCRIAVFFLIFIKESVQWSGHYQSYQVVTGHRYVHGWYSRCGWWRCCYHGSWSQTLYATRSRCLPMWTHNGDENCNIPLCSPSCGSGKCIVSTYGVHRCDCPDGRTGPSCSGIECSFNDPCYPGECQSGSDESRLICNCQPGFSESTCLTLPIDWEATITDTKARMSFWKRASNPTNEEYGLEIYSTEKSSAKWTNMEKFNWLNFSATAIFDQATPPPPSYIIDSGFGITEAVMHMILEKKPAGGGVPAVRTKETITCGTYTYTSPKNMAECKISKSDLANQLENGDTMTLEFAITTGGFRTLINGKTGDTGNDRYSENKVTTSVSYRFDFEKPYFTGSKSDAFHTNNDFTKSPIELRWSGWTDDLSEMDRYSLEYFLLEPNGDGDLREVDKMRPDLHKAVEHTIPIQYPLPIKPAKPGMYSFVLEAVDKANNSVYMRRCILYDPESSVTTDSQHGIFISSAHKDNDGQQWINSASTPIVATWTNHFLNYAHEKSKYLNKILELSVLLVPGENIFKRVDKHYDDYEGDRTVNAVPNVRGIIRFETAQAVNKSGGKIVTVPLDWKEGFHLNTSATVVEGETTSGSTLTFWVKAFDVLGNRKVGSTSVSFDFTNPSVGKLELHRNKPSAIPFSSILEVSSIDLESGIDHVQVKVTQISDGHLLTNRTLPVQSLLRKDCKDTITDCYCPTTLKVCYKRINGLAISNCWLMVPMNLKTEEVRLEVGVVNRAMLMKSDIITITDLMLLNGTKAYFGPMNARVDKISKSGVRITWHHSPTCYPRINIWLSYDDSENMIQIFKDAESYDLTDLDPGTEYTVKVMTDYGDVKSKPVVISFRTLDAPGIGAGTIAGIVIGLLIIITVLVVGFFLWRTGKVAAMIRRQQSRFGRSTRRGQRSLGQESRIVNNVLQPKNSNSKLGIVAYKNNACAVEDDIYVYGSMEFTSEQPWYIPKSKLTLLEEINAGRFARIYKADYKSASSKDVVAKMLKDAQTEENRLLMMAKINFAATQVGEHRNILRFVGSVLDNDALGPVLVVEYCENGQLDKWLVSHQGKVDVEMLERVQTFALGVARGMEFLTGKGIAHRKLAARNCLLTFVYEVKVTGFGPCSMDENSADDNVRGGRIPIKWSAPECLKSMRGANEKSDIWSYGITLWEIFSMGKCPYPDIRSRDLPVKIQNGYRLGRPEFAEDVHYELMKSCWHDRPDQRPTFTMTVDKLEKSFGLRQTSGEMYYYAQ